MQLYPWLVGDWEMDVLVHKEDGSKATTRGTIHAGWVLAGRAIQDVFAVPGMFHGTSLRFYDPHIHAWQIFWIYPLKQVFFWMVGRPQGNDIINEGKETPELARAYGLPANSDATVPLEFHRDHARFVPLDFRTIDGPLSSAFKVSTSRAA